jgi:transposase-like protein
VKLIPESILLRKEEFLSKVKIIENGCWEWQGPLQTNGYGQFLSYRAHRISYSIYKGDPGDLLVCHSCDYRKCVRPDHLFLGTWKDNMDDMRAKGRARNNVKGFDANYCTMTPDKLAAMVKMYTEENISVREVARRFNNYDNKNLTVWLRRAGVKVDRMRKTKPDKLTPDQMQELMKLTDSGMMRKDVAKVFDIYPDLVLKLYRIGVSRGYPHLGDLK